MNIISQIFPSVSHFTQDKVLWGKNEVRTLIYKPAYSVEWLCEKENLLHFNGRDFLASEILFHRSYVAERKEEDEVSTNCLLSFKRSKKKRKNKAFYVLSARKNHKLVFPLFVRKFLACARSYRFSCQENTNWSHFLTNPKLLIKINMESKTKARKLSVIVSIKFDFSSLCLVCYQILTCLLCCLLVSKLWVLFIGL